MFGDFNILYFAITVIAAIIGYFIVKAIGLAIIKAIVIPIIKSIWYASFKSKKKKSKRGK